MGEPGFKPESKAKRIMGSRMRCRPNSPALAVAMGGPAEAVLLADLAAHVTLPSFALLACAVCTERGDTSALCGFVCGVVGSLTA